MGVRKEPAPRKTVQGICSGLSALIQALVTCTPSQPECRAPRGEGRCPEFTQGVQAELGTRVPVLRTPETHSSLALCSLILSTNVN